MPSRDERDWRDLLASAQAASDQHMAALRDLEAPLRAFSEAAARLDLALAEAGYTHHARVATLVTAALGVGLTGEDG